MKKIVIGMSGGLDSTTLLYKYINEGYQVHCCVFKYGSKHNVYERKAALEILIFLIAKYSRSIVVHHNIDLSNAFLQSKSNLLKSGGDVPDGHFMDTIMEKTIVPGRNLIFASIMAGLAESINAEYISLGVHAGDHTIYPDCRPGFINGLKNVITYSSDGAVDVLTPFSGLQKDDVLKLALELGVPIELTRTCYKEQPIACGVCASCMERLEAFKNLGIKDPIKYMEE